MLDFGLAYDFCSAIMSKIRSLWHAPNYRGFFCASCVYFLHLELANPLLADDGHYHTPVFQPGDVNQKMWLSEAKKKKIYIYIHIYISYTQLDCGAVDV